MSGPISTSPHAPNAVAFQEAPPIEAGRSLWMDGLYRLRKDRLAVLSFWIIVFYAGIGLLASLGVIASSWNVSVGDRYLPPSLKSLPLLLGTDLFGLSVFYKVIQGTRIAMSVGFVSTAIATPIGIGLGAMAGYFGGLIDEVVVWIYTTLSSIPSIMLLIAITYALGKGMGAMYIALSVTAWVSLARVIRGEVIKQKGRDYVVAAESLGASHFSRIFKHILPNVSHFVIINMSIQFMSAIKAEVILSFLGLGVQGQPSWGVMIDDARMELTRGVWWQLAGATAGMFFIVLAFNILGDALRDALDPKIR